MKNILYICALLLSAFPLFGQATTGYHRVNQVIARSNSGTTALVVPFAKISVTDTATGIAAVIYFDPLLSSQIPSSLVTADLSGNYNYYMPLNTCNTESISAPGQSGIVIPNICGNPASTVTLETNGVNNGSQSLLNLVAGTGIVLANVGGAVTINASGTSGVTSINSTTGAFTFTGSGVSCASTTCTFSGGGGSSLDVKTNSVDNLSQTLLNFISANGFTFTNPSGGVLNAGVDGTHFLPTNTGLSTSYLGADASYHLVPTSLPPSGAAGGVLGGTYPNPTTAVTPYLYASLNLPHWRASLAKVKQGTGQARFCAVGDSTTAGFFANGPPSGNSNLYSYPTQLANILQTGYGIRAQSQAVFEGGQELPSGGDPRIVVGSSWSLVTSLGGIPNGTSLATTSTNALSFTPSIPVDTFRLIYVIETTEGTGSVNIDGGSSTGFTGTGAAGVGVLTVTAGSLGTHTLNILEVSGSVHVIGFEAYDSTHSSVIIENIGAPGITAASLAANTKPYNAGTAAMYTAIGCDVVNLNDGLNDWGTGVSVGTYTTNIQTVITAIKGGGSDVILESPNHSDPATGIASEATQATFVEALRGLALANSENNLASVPLPFINTWARWQTFAISSALGLYGDPSGTPSEHPGTVGYREKADQIAQAIAETPSQNNGEWDYRTLLQINPNTSVTTSLKAFSAPSYTDTGFSVAGCVTNTSAGLFGTAPCPATLTGVRFANGASPDTVATSPQLVTALNISPSTTLAVALLPLATTSAFGAVKPDGTSITISGGVISSVSGGSGTVTHTVGALTALACILGNGGGDIKIDTACSSDGAGNYTMLSATFSGTNNGFANFTFTGTRATGPGTNTFQISPAVSVTTPWSLSPAAAPASGYFKGTNTAGVVQQSFVSAIPNTDLATPPITKAAVASNFLTSYTATTGLFTASQPAFTDISGTLAAAQCPLATTSAFGCVKPDGTSITISGGVISSTSGGASFPGTNNVVFNTSTTASRNATSTDIIALWTSCTLGFLKFDGTCANPSGAGTVTSVALTVPSFLSVTGSPVTSSGTLAVTLTSASAHNFLGNNTGSSGTPAMSLIGVSDIYPNSFIVGAGLVNVMTATLSPAATALTNGLQVWVLPNLANTSTTPTLNVSGLGAVTITKSVTGTISALATNDYVTTLAAHLFYDGTEWVLLNPQTASAGGTTWNGITNPTGNLSLAMGTNLTTFTWNQTSGTNTDFLVTDTASNAATGVLFKVQTAASSTEVPFEVDRQGAIGFKLLPGGDFLIGTSTDCFSIVCVNGTVQANGILSQGSNATTVISTLVTANNANGVGTGEGINFNANNSVSTAKTWANIFAITTNNTSTTEAGDLAFKTISAGTLAEKLRLTAVGDLNIELGHLTFAQTTAPVASSCGGGTIATGGTDNVFSVTGITAATACTVTFNRAIKQGICTVSTSSTSIASSIGSISTSAVTFGMALFTGTLYGICY